MRKALRLLAGAAVAAATAVAVAPAAHAAGYDGICTGGDALTGVTIVIDFQELDGNGGTAAPTVTRCSPNPSPGTQRTGIKAVQDAGISITGTAQWGLGFVCRLQGRPSSSEDLMIGNPPSTYHEACVQTPPGAAYWSYWWADGSGSSWNYSSYGAANRNVVPGGFEGWSFSLNKTSSTNPPPEVTPRNPAVNANNPAVTLSVDDLDHKITLGQSTTLSWSSTHTSTLTASAVSPATGGGAWSGSLAVPGGSKSVKPTAKGTYTYTIKAVGGGQTVYQSATLTVA